MSYWNHYIITEERRVSLENIETALQAVNPAFQVDEDIVWLPDEEHGELEYAQITIEDITEEMPLLDKEFFSGCMRGKRNETSLLTALDNAKSIVSLQMLNVSLWHSREYAQTLAPLQDWLLNNREGILYVEGGAFYDRSGLLE